MATPPSDNPIHSDPAPRPGGAAAVRIFRSDATGCFLFRNNRFVVTVQLDTGDGGTTTVQAHCPNPGRLQELYIPGSPVLLEDSAQDPQSNPRKHRWTLTALSHHGVWVPMVSAASNRIVRELIIPELFPLISEIRSEVVYADRRFDHMVTTPRTAPDLRSSASPRPGDVAGYAPGSDQSAATAAGLLRTYIEVKSCSLVEEGLGMFPDAPSVRASEHLEHLSAIATGRTIDTDGGAAPVSAVPAAEERRAPSAAAAQVAGTGGFDSSAAETARAGGLAAINSDQAAPATRAMVIFTLTHGNAGWFAPNYHNDRRFALALESARAAGVKIRAVPVNCDGEGMVRRAGDEPRLFITEAAQLAALDSGWIFSFRRSGGDRPGGDQPAEAVQAEGSGAENTGRIREPQSPGKPDRTSTSGNNISPSWLFEMEYCSNDFDRRCDRRAKELGSVKAIIPLRCGQEHGLIGKFSALLGAPDSRSPERLPPEAPIPGEPGRETESPLISSPTDNDGGELTANSPTASWTFSRHPLDDRAFNGLLFSLRHRVSMEELQAVSD